MPTPVEMPKLGNNVEECLFSGWRKQKGDPVEKGRFVDAGRLGNCRYTEQLTVLLLGINLRVRQTVGIRLTNLQP
jgi:hypothetical protein